MTSTNPPLVSPRSSSLFPGRHALTTPLARLAARTPPPSLTRDKSYFVHPEEVEGRLFLGFDCSTQALKVVAVNESLQVVAEAKVDFSDEIPRFGTKSGVLLGPGGIVNAPVEMYIEALDLLMEKLKKSDFPFWKVSAISGAGQQHALVLFSHLAPTILSPSHISPLLPLASQVLEAFSSPLVSNWQDSSTTAECLELEAALPRGREEMAQITGSKAHERFTGPQVLKVVKNQKEVWKNTSRVGIVSSWLATMLCLDGEVKGIDESDSCGMDLFDIPSRTFNSILCSAASQSSSPDDLLSKLGKVELDPSRVVGHIGQYFVDRYGFDKNCCVAPFTGDNPSTLLSFSLSPGDAIVSLGTSDTVLLASNHYQPSPDFHVFSHPAGDSPDGSRRYMAMLCYKNGSLPRERLRNEFCSGSWDDFNASILTTPLPTPSSITTFNFDKPEIIPPAVHGTHVFRAGKRLEGGEANLSEAEKKECVRRGVESQFLSFRARVKGVLGGEGGGSEGRLKRVFVAGGGSVNPVITSLLSDILGCPVFVASGSAQGCAIGASYRAAWSFKKLTSPDIDFDDLVNQAKTGSLHGSSTDQGMKLVAEPDHIKFEAYGKFLGDWEKMEEEVIRVCGAQK